MTCVYSSTRWDRRIAAYGMATTPSGAASVTSCAVAPISSPVTLSRGRREVSVDERSVELTQREFDLLAYLMERPGIVVGRHELLESVWGFVVPDDTRTVEGHVAQLRKKLGRPELVRTLRGVGYKFVAS